MRILVSQATTTFRGCGVGSTHRTVNAKGRNSPTVGSSPTLGANTMEEESFETTLDTDEDAVYDYRVVAEDFETEEWFEEEGEDRIRYN